MSRRLRKVVLSLVLLAVAIALAAVGTIGATHAWFIDLKQTPAGNITSGIVHYLPEGEQNAESLITYGNLAGGSSISPEGISHILPGDSLLATASVTVEHGVTKRLVSTSIARASWSEGTPETQGTVIHGEIRYAADADGKRHPVTRTQRDLMATENTEEWRDAGGAVITKPEINAGLYDIVTTSKTDEEKTASSTITTTTVTTSYTGRESKKLAYLHIRTTRVTVTHEAAVVSDLSVDWDTLAQYPSILSEETVLSVQDGVTRSRLLLTECTEDGGSGSTKQSLPLAVGNVSTVETNLRLGVSAALVSGGTEEALQLKQLENGDFALGKTGAKGSFIELLVFHPTKLTEYQWTAAASTEGVTRPDYLWDLALADGSTVLPAVQSEDGTEVQPTCYTVMDSFEVAARSYSNVGAADFESEFNELYCRNSPMIRLHVGFYAKQADYMEWSEFSSRTITMRF